MGVIGGIAGLMAMQRTPGSREWLLVWGIAGALAAAIGAASLIWKSLALYGREWRAPGRRFVYALLPALFAGGLLTYTLAPLAPQQLPLVWLACYGAGVFAAGVNSIRAIPVMGLLFLLGAVAVTVQPSAADLVLMATFGAAHVGFGILIWVRHGG